MSDRLGNKPGGELDAEALQALPAKTLSYYDILQNEDGGLLFCIKRVNTPIGEDFPPRIYYDGGDHAIFLKNRDSAVVCDFVHPAVRESLRDAKEVRIAEVFGGEVDAEYKADVLLMDGIEDAAKHLMAKSAKGEGESEGEGAGEGEGADADEGVGASESAGAITGEGEGADEEADEDEDAGVDGMGVSAAWLREALRLQIFKTVSDHFGVPAEDLSMGSTLDGDIGMDHLDRIELCMSIEEEYMIIISDDEMERWRTLGDVLAYMYSLIDIDEDDEDGGGFDGGGADDGMDDDDDEDDDDLCLGDDFYENEADSQ